ncbi:hypothetical protein V5097_02165 [Arenibacter palladensis]|uniref:hypothetical protein n=1 Tax=Arenibacter palladensis TaxID=237373 RepID=UPI002FD151B5
MPNQSKLENTFNEIVDVNERLLTLNDLELAELRNHLSNRYQNLMKTVIANTPLPLDPKSETYKQIRLSTVDKNNYNAPFIKHFIKKIDKIRMKQHLDIFDATIFLNPKSQTFFNYVFEHWLRHEKTMNHLHFVFRKLWFKNESKTYYRSDNFIITCSFKLFAQNWNAKYLRMCPSKDLEIKRFNLRTFEEIGFPVCDELDQKIKAIEPAYIKETINTPKLP